MDYPNQTIKTKSTLLFLQICTATNSQKYEDKKKAGIYIMYSSVQKKKLVLEEIFPSTTNLYMGLIIQISCTRKILIQYYVSFFRLRE